MLNSILDTSNLEIVQVLCCMGAAVVLGLLNALLYMASSRASKSFVCTLALLPLVTGAVILVVNGNLGAGIAVAGSFSLIRFRSAQGSAKEILHVFLSASLGLCLGAGYVGLAVLLFAVFALAALALNAARLGEKPDMSRLLKITVPEVLDYDGLFDEVLSRRTDSWSLESVRTAEMGSVYQLHYLVRLKDLAKTKELLDEVRTRNGNLPVSVVRVPVEKETF